MKQIFLYLSFLLISLTLVSCDVATENSITFQNIASNGVYINFRAQRIDVPAGSTVKLTKIDRGEYTYETIYEVPANATSSEASENLSGTFTIKAGTKILVIYSSVFDESSIYYIYASISSSDDLTANEIVNPIGP